VIRLLRESSPEGCVKLIVLLSADSPAAVEARQVLLGADVVHRDPVRIDVIGAYIARFRSLRPSMVMEPAPAGRRALYFAGAMVDVMERTLRHGDRSVSITPREVELIQLLFESRGGVATYDILYNEILDRRFCGDTSNMRVLLGKLAGSFRRVGLSFRQHIEVVPKTGYRYSDPAAGLESG
jgi:DNA-binding winged helix-turn-helix (wHTH) protein